LLLKAYRFKWLNGATTAVLEANRNGLEHSRPMAIAKALLEMIATLLGLRDAERKTCLDQRHLRRKMISLKNFNASLSITEANIIYAAVITGTVQPDGVHHRGFKNFKNSGETSTRPRAGL
jgi:hypothetical protein